MGFWWSGPRKVWEGGSSLISILPNVRPNGIKEIINSVSKLSSSIRKAAKKAVINVFQCKRLANRIDAIAKKLKVPENILHKEDFSKVLESFLIVLMRARLLVIECGGTEWLWTALIRGINKEAFEVVHKELTNFQNKIPSFASTDEGSPHSNTAMNEDAEYDLRDMLEMFKNYRRPSEEGATPSMAAEEELDSRRVNFLRVLIYFMKNKSTKKRRMQRNNGKCCNNVGEHGKMHKSPMEHWGTQGNVGEAVAVFPMLFRMRFSRAGKYIKNCTGCAVLATLVWRQPAPGLAISGAYLKQCPIERLEQIIKVISDKSKDQACYHALGEQNSSPSYLQISETEIVCKRHIGTGSYGEVYEVEWLGCKLCMKELPWPTGYGNSNGRGYDQMLKQLYLRHPNVLQLVGYLPSTVDSKPPKVLTEIMQGDIRSFIDKRMKQQDGKGTPFNRRMTLDIMIQVARGLVYMHQNGFMHGDRVLTTNIITKVCGDYIDARIGDLGVPLDVPLKYIHVHEPRIGDVEGVETARWMAPEVCAKFARYAPSSDIYSFGIFCYELLTGKIPFDSYKNVTKVHSQIMAGELRPNLPEDLDGEVAKIIKRCWHVDPSSRPSAKEILEHLENIQFLPTHVA